MQITISVASALVASVLIKLRDAVLDELGLLWGFKGSIKKLERLLVTISKVLEDAERRSVSDEALQKWLRDLKDAAYDAEDVVDAIQTEALRRVRMAEVLGPKRAKVRDFFSSRNSVAFRFRMVNKVQAIIGKFDEISEERKKFHLAERPVIEGHAAARRETFSRVDESDVFGRDADKEIIIKYLTDIDNERDLAVLPVVGLGGAGKTTLARLVFNHKTIKDRFDLRIWVSVSEDFNVKGIAKAIVENITKKVHELQRIEDIQHSLRENLAGKRYLLVLDDVWNEDESEWDELKLLLRGGKEGTKIIVTTRSQIVARIMGTTRDGPYNLQILSDDDCWIIFKNRAFGPGSETETPNLEKIGREIVSKCGGLPLAAKSLGSLMATKRGEAEWSAVRDSEIWRLAVGTDRILPALEISYDNLPLQLKQCFTYCSLFPKDHDISRLELIELWIAEGLVRPSDGMLAEDVGIQCFNNLMWRSFLQEEKENYPNGNVSCKMHDLVHDLARFVSKDEFYMIGTHNERLVPRGCRFSSIVSDGSLSLNTVETAYEVKKLRSLSLYNHEKFEVEALEKLASYAMSKLSRLRALRLHGLSRCPGSINKLKHLRFLDLSSSKLTTLPKSIGSLYNLHTLKLIGCEQLIEIPDGVVYMRRLRHLHLWNTWYVQMPRELGRLTSLQTLDVFNVGKESGRSIAELQNLNQIGSSMWIENLQYVKSSKEAAAANLKAKTNLQFLGMDWKGSPVLDTDCKVLSAMEYEAILENLELPSSVRQFKLESYPGTSFPLWKKQMVNLSSLSRNLVQVTLKFLDKCECLPPLGQLPSLEYLFLHKMNAVKKIGIEFYGDGCFPKLQTFWLWECPMLEEWSLMTSDRGAFPCLEYLEIWCCPKLAIVDCFPSSLQQLNINSCDTVLLSLGRSFRGLSRIRKLQIKGSDEQSHLQLECEWEGLQYLTALEELNIERFGMLTFLPDSILNCHFPSLHTMNLWRLYSLESLGMKDERLRTPPFFSALRHLYLWRCDSLATLPEWVGGITSLQSLKLELCANLRMLPDGLQRLNNLQLLTLHDYPVLSVRCKADGGEDWNKISHIPNINILPL